MDNKPGRNDPCPCGSGKKYKKCCFLTEESGPAADFSGTSELFDAFIKMNIAIAAYRDKIIQFERDGRDLKKKLEEFEKEFEPGEPDRIPDSFYVPWSLLDLRFGAANKAIPERMLEDKSLINKTDKETPFYNVLTSFAYSHYAFYRVVSCKPEELILQDIYTGDDYTVFPSHDMPFEPNSNRDILFTRLVGTPQQSYIFTACDVLAPDMDSAIREVIDDFIEESDASASMPQYESYVRAMKDNHPKILRLLARGYFDVSKPKLPKLVNKDGHAVKFITLHYNVTDLPLFKERIKKMKMIEKEDDSDEWHWMKRGTGPAETRTLKGVMKLHGDILICDLNSEERAASLMSKITTELGRSVKFTHSEYHSTESALKEFRAIPKTPVPEKQLTPAQQAEIDAKLREYLDDHYLKDWVKDHIPALDHKRPIDLVKTQAGRKKVEELISQMEHMDEVMGKNDFDFNKLRKKLKLI